MGRIDLSNIDMGAINKNSDTNVEKVIGEVVTINNNENELLAASVTGTAGASAILPVMGILDKAIGLLDDGLRCYAIVRTESERTAQIRYQSEALIAGAEQKTKQIRIQEKENTKRYKMECEKEIKLEKIKLIELKERLQEEKNKNNASHEENMKELKNVENVIKSFLEQNRNYIDEIKYTTDFHEKEKIMEQMTKINSEMSSLLKMMILNRR